MTLDKRGDITEDETFDLLSASLQQLPTVASPDDEPPAAVVSGAMWVHQWLTMDAELAELTFDSNHEPELAGVRSSGHLRELTFVSGEYTIEIQIEMGPRRALVSGTIDPPAAADLELLVSGEVFSGSAGEGGAFLIEDVPSGTVLAFFTVSDRKIRLGSFEI